MGDGGKSPSSNVTTETPNANATRISWRPICTAIAGFSAGIVEETVSYPLDLLKTKIQIHAVPVSVLQMAQRVWRTEKLLGLFKGLPAPVVASAAVSGILFGTYGWSIDALSSAPALTPSAKDILISGAVAGFVQSFLTCSVDVVKNRRQVGQHPSTWKAFVHIWNGRKMEFLTGIRPTIARDVIGYAAFFWTYEYLKNYFHAKEPDETSDFFDVWSTAVAGSVAGVAYTLLPYPLDVVKTAMQTQQANTVPYYDGLWRGMVSLFRRQALYRGVVPTSLKTSLSSVIHLLVYEYFYHLLIPLMSNPTSTAHQANT